MSAPLDPRLAPWSPEAEQSLLGALLQDNDSLLSIADRKLRPTDLFDPRHRVVLAAITELAQRRRPTDPVTVFDALRDRGLADAAGGLDYINALAVCVPSARNAAAYADRIIDKAQRRAILVALDQAADLARAPGDAAEALDRVEALVVGLRRDREGGTLRRAGELFAARMARWERLEAGSVEPGISTGLPVLDGVLGGGLHPGHVVNIGARPSIGKTSLAAQIGGRVAGAGHPVLIASAEMPADELIDRSATNASGVPLERFKSGQFEPGDWSEIVAAGDAMSKAPLYIDDKAGMTLLDIRASARRVVREHGYVSLIVVDHVQLVQASGNFNTRHHAIEQISRGLKVLAKELATTVIVLSQLNRGGADDEPELHHLKESGAIEEDADAVLLLHPLGHAPEGGTLVLCKVAKNRHGRRGRFGLAFDGSTQRWQSSTGNVARHGT